MKRNNYNRKRRNNNNNNDKGKTYSGSYRPRRRSGNRNQYPPSEMSKIYRRYDYLFEIYLAARKKYFEQYHRADGNQKPKLHKNYFAALKQLRDMERSLTKDQRYKLRKRHCTFRPDTTISSQIEDGNWAVETPEKASHHILDSQFQCNYSDDFEESSGTIEDYKSLKGIS